MKPILVGNYEIDGLDLQILEILQRDARTPFLEIARSLEVSGGTIHQRYDKLKKAGIILGSSIEVDYTKIGHEVTVLLGLHLNNAKSVNKVVQKLKNIPEVIESYYTTGSFALIIKIQTKNIDSFHQFLTKKLQAIEEIRSTESFISLQAPIHRKLKIV